MGNQAGRGLGKEFGLNGARLLTTVALTLNGALPVLGEPHPKGAEERQKYEEYETRAAFIFVFAKYTEWLPQRMGPNDPFVVGILGDSPLGQALEKQASLTTVQGHKVLVKRFRNATEVQDCHLLYFPAQTERQLLDLRSRLAQEGVLTVGETSFFLGFGGGVHLFREEGSLHFVVNRAVLEQSRLRVASRALNLAKKVIAEPWNP